MSGGNGRNGLTAADYAALDRRWITPELADAAGIRRVEDAEGRELVGAGKRSGSYAGLLIPYHRPGTDVAHEYRLRRDEPDLEVVAGGKLKESRKYVSPPGRGNILYIPPGCQPRN